MIVNCSFIVTFSLKATAFNCFDLCYIVSKLTLTEPLKILLVYSFVLVACCILSKYTRSQVGHLISKKGRGCLLYVHCTIGVSSLRVPGVPCHPQILADKLTLSQPGGQIMPT